MLISLRICSDSAESTSVSHQFRCKKSIAPFNNQLKRKKTYFLMTENRITQGLCNTKYDSSLNSPTPGNEMIPRDSLFTVTCARDVGKYLSPLQNYIKKSHYWE